MGERVALRDERTGQDIRRLWARLDDDGRLLIEGQDLGPGTAPVSSDGEYEWSRTYAPEDIPALMQALGAAPDADPFDVLREWAGPRSYDLETICRTCGVPSRVWSHGG